MRTSSVRNAVALGAMAALAVGLAAELALVQPKDLAAQISAGKANATIVYVGPNVMFRGKRIPGAIYGGPAATAAGLEVLKQAVEKLPRDRALVIYCGCCPWAHCPNVKPAVDFLGRMGFTRVKTLYVETGFGTDWIDKGYPVEAGTPKP